MRHHVIEAIGIHALGVPGKRALVDSRVSLDFGELDRFSSRFALRLRALGCRPGDRVVMLANRCAVLVAAILGTCKAIQRVINSVRDVYASEIVVLETKHGEKILAAGILLDKGQDPQVEQHLDLIKRRLAEELPGYMVPRHLTVLDQFPQLSSGKADRKTLQSILENRMNSQSQEVMAP